MSWKIAVDYFRLEPGRRYHILFQPLFDRTVLLFHQARVILLRRCLELPLILEQGGVVYVIENFAQIVILYHAHSPERRLGNIRRIGYYCAALGKHGADLFIHRCRFRIFFYGSAIF